MSETGLPLQSDQMIATYRVVKEKIDALDEQLDALSDRKGAGKRALINAMIEEQKEDWGGTLQNFSAALSNVENEKGFEVAAGIYYGFLKAITDQFKEKFDKFVQEKVDAQPVTQVVEMSPEEVEKLSEQRKAYAKQAKMIMELGTTLGANEDDFPKIKVRTGARGKRGPRALSLFDWFIDGEALSGEDNSLLAVSRAHGYEKKADLTKAMKDGGIDTKEPEDQITFTLKDGKVLTGQKRADAMSDEEDEDDEDDEDETPDD